MNNEEKKAKRADLLEKTIAIYRKTYYNGVVDGREITDDEYNAMEAEHKSLKPDSPIFTAIGDEISSGFEKGKHSIPMGSQSKCANMEEFRDWWRLLGIKGNLLASYKLDGASLALYYDKGQLQQAITRGDGLVGRIITSNAKKFIGVPQKIKYKGQLSVRGEALLSVEKWKQIDPEALNPRNLGTGIMGREDGEGSENLRFIAFDVEAGGFDKEAMFESKMAKLEWLQEQFFETTPYFFCSYDEKNSSLITDDIEYHYNIINNERTDNAVEIDGEHFWIDGIVIELNDLASQDVLGISSGRPKFSTALKFPSPGAETKLDDVELSVGHTGAIFPTGLVVPVEIGGTQVSRVTLNNWDYIENMDIAIGDIVKVVKAGDIIPKIVSVVKRSNDRKEIVAPTSCPVCGGKVGKDTNVDGSEAVVLKCLNPKCEAKAVGKIKRLINSLDILEVGDAIVEGMYKAGVVKNVADLFKLESK
jgi:DNA ligase (NAD+)